MTARLATAYLRSALRARELWAVAAVGLGLTFVGNLWLGAAFEPRGALGTWLLDVEGSLTYGLATALLAGGLGASTVLRVRAALHARGVSAGEAVSAAVLAAAAIGLLVRLFVSAVQLASGLVDGVARSGELIFGSPQPLDAGTTAVAELRTFAVYALAGVVGATAAAALRSSLLVAVGLGIVVVPYLPVFAGVVNRASAALDGLAVLPFGALRATVSGNAGLFGTSTEGVRLVRPEVGAAVVSAWIAVALVVALVRATGAVRGRRIRAHFAVAATCGLVAAVAAGAFLPPALADGVPWRWRPEWRKAVGAGWASHQVAARWVAAVRSGRAVPQLFAEGRVPADLTASRLTGVRRAAQVAIQPQRQLRDPLHVAVSLAFDPPVVTGNVAVRAALLELTFVRRHGRYLIRSVNGPAITAAEVR